MVLRYSVTIEDILAFYCFHWTQSKTMRNYVRFYSVLLGVLLFFACMYTMVALFATLDIILPALISVVGVILFRFVDRKYRERHARKMVCEDDNPGLIGEHHLSYDTDWLIRKTDVNELRTIWPAILRVAQTKTHVFIYLGSASAITIPLERIIEGDTRAFIEQIKRLVAEHQPANRTWPD